MSHAADPKPAIQEPPRPIEPPREDPPPSKPPQRDPRRRGRPPVIMPPPHVPHLPSIEPPAPDAPDPVVPPGTPFLPERRNAAMIAPTAGQRNATRLTTATAPLSVAIRVAGLAGQRERQQ